MSTLATSPGWKESPAKRSHSLAPLTSTPMRVGKIRRASAASRMVYSNRAARSSEGTAMSVPTIAPTPTSSHTICWAPSAASSLVTKASPTPESNAVSGSKTGSAAGAR